MTKLVCLDARKLNYDDSIKFEKMSNEELRDMLMSHPDIESYTIINSFGEVRKTFRVPKRFSKEIFKKHIKNIFDMYRLGIMLNISWRK